MAKQPKRSLLSWEDITRLRDSCTTACHSGRRREGPNTTSAIIKSTQGGWLTATHLKSQVTISKRHHLVLTSHSKPSPALGGSSTMEQSGQMTKPWSSVLEKGATNSLIQVREVRYKIQFHFYLSIFPYLSTIFSEWEFSLNQREHKVKRREQKVHQRHRRIIWFRRFR